MTLHDAIETVLLQVGRPMTTVELAQRVNDCGLYVKRDGSPVSAFQISGRTRKYPSLFGRAGSTVSLDRWDDSRSLPELESTSNAEAVTASLGITPAPFTVESSEL